MKINSINIFSFGCLKNVVLNFDKGFNVIYGNNENGKTTIMSFIKMMFYGNERGSSVISKNLRKKYSPWDGSTMAGSIEFEHAEKKYRLEREFRSSNSTDKIFLCDLDFGTRQAVSGDIGATFFGLSLAAFERSVFIGQFGFPEKDTSAEGEINSKLSNIVTTGDESTSYETVNSRLQKAKLSLMSKSGRAGEYDKNIQLLQQMTEQLEQSKAAQSYILSLKSDIEVLKKCIDGMQNEAKALKEKIDTEQDVKNAQKLKEMLTYKEKLDRLNEKLQLSDGKPVDEMFVSKILFCISKIDSLNEKIRLKKAEEKSIEESIDLATNSSREITPQKADQIKCEIDKLQHEKSIAEQKISVLEKEYAKHSNEQDLINKSTKAFNLPLLITAIIFACISTSFFVLKFLAFGVISGIIGVMSLILSFIIRPKDAKKINAYREFLLDTNSRLLQMQSNTKTIAQQICSLTAQLNTIENAINNNAGIINTQKKRLEECRAQIQVETDSINTETTTLLSLYNRYKPALTVEEIKSQLSDISEKANEQKELKQQLNYIIKDIGNITYEEAREKLRKANLISIESTNNFPVLKRNYEELLAEITNKKTKLAELLVQLKTDIENSESPELIEAEIEKLKSKTDSQRVFCDTLDIAAQVLTESFVQLRRSYSSILEQKSSEIFNGLTDENYKSMSISKSFEINVEKSGVFGGKSLDYLSSGTADQAYLSLRLALSSLISETSGEPLPVLLDDALAQYDDERIKTALTFLKKYSDCEQIIMFTCHNSIYAMSKTVGADCKKL